MGTSPPLERLRLFFITHPSIPAVIYRQIKIESRRLPFFTLEGQFAVMILDDAQADRKPQACARRAAFGGIERIENALPDFIRDARCAP